jgi:hypothetical protein
VTKEDDAPVQVSCCREESDQEKDLGGRDENSAVNDQVHE